MTTAAAAAAEMTPMESLLVAMAAVTMTRTENQAVVMVAAATTLTAYVFRSPSLPYLLSLFPDYHLPSPE